MNWTTSRSTVAMSLAINLVLIGVTAAHNSSLSHEFYSITSSFLGFIAAIAVVVGFAVAGSWPWFLALKQPQAARTISAVAFATVSAVSGISIFMPNSANQSETFGFYLLAHLGIVWVAYALSFQVWRSSRDE